jgi:hypothetical protein
VAGCLRCLGVMAADLDSEQAPQLLQSLSAELAALVSSPQTPPSLSATCFSIMAQLTAALASLSGAYQRQVRPRPPLTLQRLGPMFTGLLALPLPLPQCAVIWFFLCSGSLGMPLATACSATLLIVCVCR